MPNKSMASYLVGCFENWDSSRCSYDIYLWPKYISHHNKCNICSLISHEIDRLYVTELLSSKGLCLLERPNESPLVFLFFERESPLVNHSYENGFKNSNNLWLHYLHNPFFNYVLINIFLLHRKRRVDRFDYQFHSQALTLKNWCMIKKFRHQT